MILFYHNVFSLIGRPISIISHHCYYIAFKTGVIMTTRNTHNVDSGQAWLILLAISIVDFLSQGLKKALSVLLPTLRDQFKTHTWMIGTIIALTYGIKDFAGKFCKSKKRLK